MEQFDDPHAGIVKLIERKSDEVLGSHRQSFS